MRKICLLSVLSILLSFTCCIDQKKPTLFFIGDSTVKAGWGNGEGGLYGWGQIIGQYFDSTLIDVKNDARGGTSSRTYRTLGLWDSVLVQITPGDFVLMQFGHNDDGPVNDDFRARGTIYGIGDEQEEIDNMLTGQHEIVHTYGWYMSKYINEAKEKGATPIILAPIPRNDWEDGMVPRNNDKYGLWSEQVARRESIGFIDLNEKLATKMESMGKDSVMNYLFYHRDHTHTSVQGAAIGASLVVEGLQELPASTLKNYLFKKPTIVLPNDGKLEL